MSSCCQIGQACDLVRVLWEAAICGASLSSSLHLSSLSDPCHFSWLCDFDKIAKTPHFWLYVCNSTGAVLAELINAGGQRWSFHCEEGVNGLPGGSSWPLETEGRSVDVTKLWTLREGRWSWIDLGTNIIPVGPKKLQTGMWLQRSEWGSWWLWLVSWRMWASHRSWDPTTSEGTEPWLYFDFSPLKTIDITQCLSSCQSTDLWLPWI